VSPPVRVFQLPALLPIPDLTQSHSIALVQGELLIVSTKHRSRSHSIPISFDRPFKARVLGSSPSRLTTSYKRKKLQNDLQPLPACLVVLATVFKNLSSIQDLRSRFFKGFDVSFRLFQKQMISAEKKRMVRISLYNLGKRNDLQRMAGR